MPVVGFAAVTIVATIIVFLLAVFLERTVMVRLRAWRKRHARRAAQQAARRLMATVVFVPCSTHWMDCLRAAVDGADTEDSRTVAAFLQRYGTRSITVRANRLAKREHRTFPTDKPHQDAEFAMRAFIHL